MATKKKVKKLKYRLCLFVPACLVVMITIFVSVGSYWVQIVEKYKEKSMLEEEIIEKKKKEEALKVDVENDGLIVRQ